MTRRHVKTAAGAASLAAGGLSLTAASVTTAVGLCAGISDHSICGTVIAAAAVLITFGFTADGGTGVLDGITGKIVHAGMTAGLAGLLLLAALGALGFTVVGAPGFALVGVPGFAGILGFAAAGVGLTAGALATARRSSA